MQIENTTALFLTGAEIKLNDSLLGGETLIWSTVISADENSFTYADKNGNTFTEKRDADNYYDVVRIVKSELIYQD